MFSRVLIANRGEIALRIIRACRDLGIQTVCVYSEEDRGQRYLSLADQAICIGPAAADQSYLRGDRIIAAAEVANVDAIHPGYGFLAENPQFAEQCLESKIEFIGPSPESMRLLGDKASAKKLAKRVKVPTIPGSENCIEDDDQAVEVARRVGYPVIVKATAGGGGRGMRIAHNEMNLRASLGQARQEAAAAFGRGDIYLEKFLTRPRHVEVQVLADRSGHAVHFYERDCTLQRRYQKLIEEAPSPALNDHTREAICKAALRICKAANYHNAATIEFLLDRQKRFYFIEANTRIQVEHPVTELLTGHDLVKWQLRIAAGETLSLKQKEIRRRGAAIECRINAEDGHNGFRPCPGQVQWVYIPGGPGVRWDSHVAVGTDISPRYDSLIGKLVVHAQDRGEALGCLSRCLDEIDIGPLRTTVPFLKDVLAHPDFRSANVDTAFIERNWS